MSHEIHVVARIGDVIDEEQLIAGLIAAKWQAPPGIDGLAYANPDTGVRASIEPLTPPVLPDGYRRLDLGLVLNYVRPTWFAVESIQGFAAAIGAAGALVLDPQADAPVPRPPDPVQLTASWTRGNEAAVGAARASGADLPWLDADRSMAWWRHQRGLPGLKLGFAAKHYVPSLRLIRRAGSDRVERAMSWPDHVPALLPACDVIVMLRLDSDAGLVIAGFVSAATIHERLDGIAERIEPRLADHPDLLLLPPDRVPEARERLASVRLEPFAGFDAVQPDAFVDIPPSSA